MGNVHFSGQNRNIPNYVLNSQHENVFDNNNIRFHIEGKYLTDFSDKGIDRFIEKNFNDKTGFLGSIGLGWGGKDLEFKEVKAFIQAVAANADQMKGMTFELTDPDLGLFDDDDVKVRDIKHSFEMRYDAVQGSSDPSVSFVDAKSVRYDHREARQAESRAKDSFDEVKETRRSLQKDLQRATRRRDKIADRIGDNALRRLAEIDGELQSMDGRLSDLDSQIRDVRARRSNGELPSSERRELGYLLRGLEAERKELVENREELNEKLEKNHGFWSFLGGGSSLEDLREANAAVEAAQSRLEDFQPEYTASRDHWQEAVRRREAVERGESLRDLDATPDEAPQADAPAAPEGERPPEGAGRTERPAPVDPSAPVAPTQGTEGPANPNMPPAEASLQRIAALSGDAQLEALQNLPEDQRLEFLQHANNYSFAGQSNNPMGFDNQVFGELANLREGVHQARLNGLLSWGDDVQSSFLEQSDAVTRQQLLDELNQNLFNAQLATQAASLKSRLEALRPSDEQEFTPEAEDSAPAPPQGGQTPVEQAPAPVETAPAQPEAPAEEITAPGQRPVTADGQDQPEVFPGQAQPLSLSDYQTLPEQAQIQRFAELSPNDQAAAFQTMSIPLKQELLLGVAASNSQEALGQLTQMMQADEKQTVANQLQRVLNETADVPAFQHTTSINMILGVLAQQGVRPQADAAPEPQPEAVAPVTEEAVQPPTEHPVVEHVDESGAAAPTGGLQPLGSGLTPVQGAPVEQAPVDEGPAEHPVVERVPVEQAPVEQAPVEQAPVEQAPVEQAPAEEDLSTADIGAETLAEAIRAADVSQNPLARAQLFFGLETDVRTDVFKALDNQLRMELLLPMAFIVHEDQTASVIADNPERTALINSLDADGKQALVDGFKETLPSSEEFSPILGQAIRILIAEAGGSVDASQAASEPPPAGQQGPELEAPGEHIHAADATQIEASPAQQGVDLALDDLVADEAVPVDSGRLDMSTQLDDLRKILSEKSLFLRNVLDEPGMRRLSFLIWESGTQANRAEMGKLLVDEGQSELLGQIMANANVKPQEVLDLLAHNDFPLKTFMDDIDDSRAFIVLYNMAQIRDGNNEPDSRAMGVISDTIDAYSGYVMDRETPFERLKSMTQNVGIWSELPQDLRSKIDDLLAYW